MRGVTFDALGRPRELRLTTNALCRLEERSGRSIRDVVTDTVTPGRQTLSYRLLFWAGLGDVTIDEAGDIIDAVGMKEADRIVADALRLAFPEPDPSAEGNGEAAA